MFVNSMAGNTKMRMVEWYIRMLMQPNSYVQMAVSLQ